MTPAMLVELEEMLQEEIEVLRSLLSTFTREQQALLAKNDELLSNILEERLCLLDSYEQLAEELHEITLPIVGDASEWTLRGILEKMGDLLDVENIALHSQREQVLALLNEIDNRNNITDLYLRREQLPRKIELRPIKKIAVEVIEPEEVPEDAMKA